MRTVNIGASSSRSRNASIAVNEKLAIANTTGVVLDSKPFLNEYAGQSLDQLLLMVEHYRLDSIIVAIDAALVKKCDRVGFAKMSPDEVVVLAVEAIERDVNSDGFTGFFGWSSELVAFAVDALTRIGCIKTAAIARDAILAAGIEGAISKELIDSMMDRVDVVRDQRLDELDNRFFLYEEDIERHLFAFISKHRTTISIP